jgi:hypothetical protein
MMTSLLFGICIFGCGLAIGFKIRGMAYDAQDWEMLKWEPNVFAFRRVKPGARLFRDEKILLALPIDTSEIPPDGVVSE